MVKRGDIVTIGKAAALIVWTTPTHVGVTVDGDFFILNKQRKWFNV